MVDRGSGTRPGLASDYSVGAKHICITLVNPPPQNTTLTTMQQGQHFFNYIEGILFGLQIY